MHRKHEGENKILVRRPVEMRPLELRWCIGEYGFNVSVLRYRPVKFAFAQAVMILAPNKAASFLIN
jgi:hypothetical protein